MNKITTKNIINSKHLRQQSNSEKTPLNNLQGIFTSKTLRHAAIFQRLRTTVASLV